MMGLSCVCVLYVPEQRVFLMKEFKCLRMLCHSGQLGGHWRIQIYRNSKERRWKDWKRLDFPGYVLSRPLSISDFLFLLLTFLFLLIGLSLSLLGANSSICSTFSPNILAQKPCTETVVLRPVSKKQQTSWMKMQIYCLTLVGPYRKVLSNFPILTPACYGEEMKSNKEIKVFTSFSNFTALLFHYFSV